MERKYLGIYYMLLAALGFSVMGAAAKLLKGSFNAGQLVFYRNAIGLVFLAIGLARHPPQQTGGKLGWLMFRGLMGTTALYTLLYCILHMPLGTAMTYNLTSSLFIALFGFILFGEFHGFRIVFAVILGFFGMLLIYKPGFSDSPWYYHFAGLVSGITSAIAYLTVGRLAKYYDSRVIVLSFLLSGIIIPSLSLLLHHLGGLPADGLFIIDYPDKKIQVYLSSPDGNSLGVLNLRHNSNPLTAKVVEHWNQGRIYREHWTKTDFMNWVNSMIDSGQIQSPETYQGSAPPPESLDLHFVPFSQGMLYVGNSSPLSENELELVKALAEAFSIAYARYLDFEQLEEAKNKVEKTLSELKATQTQLIQSEKMASLGQLTAGIAHEIKNPLNFVKNFSELSLELVHEAVTVLEKEKENESVKLASEILEELKTNLIKVNEHGKRADEIINSMLQHSRRGSGKRVLADFNHLIKEAVLLSFDTMKAGKKPIPAEIEFELDCQIGEIPVFAEELSLATINLCNNAFDAMREKLIAQSSKNKNYSPSLMIKTWKSGRYRLLSIQDNGTGIPLEIQDKILKPFFTTKKGNGGTGLGLSITNHIVRAHGGEMEIKSQPGVGSEFILKFPRNYKK